MEAEGDYGRRLAKGTAVNAAGAALGQVLELIAVAVAVQRVGAAAYGVLVLAQGWSQLPLLLESGVGQQIVRLVAAEPSNGAAPFSVGVARRFVSAVAPLYLLLASLAVVAGIGAGRLWLGPIMGLRGAAADAGQQAFDIVVAAMAIRIASSIVPRVLLGQTRLPALRAVGLVRGAVTVFATVALVQTTARGVVGAALAVLLGEMAAAACGLWAIRGSFDPRPAAWSRATAGAAIRNGGAMTAAGGIALFSNRLDPMIVATALGAAATGTYGVVLKAFDVMRSGVELLSLVLMPATARSLATGEPGLIATLYRRALTYVALVVWPAALVAMIFPASILRAWVGRDLQDGPPALAAAMALVIVLTPSAIAFYVISGSDRVSTVLGWQAAASAMSFAVSVALVRPLGVEAVFIGSAVAALVVMSAYLGVVGDLSGKPPRRLLVGLGRPVSCLTGFGLALVALRVWVPASALVPAVVVVFGLYAASALAVAVPRSDVRRLVPWRQA